jgi:hypothetical protein
MVRVDIASITSQRLLLLNVSMVMVAIPSQYDCDLLLESDSICASA